MTRLIKFSFAMILTLMVNLLFAQKSPEERAKMMVQKLTEKLALTPDQQHQATDIFTNHFKVMQDLRAKLKDDKNKTAKMAIRDQQKQTNQVFTGMLTQQQKDQYILLKKQMHEKNMNRKADKKAKGKQAPPSDLEEHLSQDMN